MAFLKPTSIKDSSIAMDKLDTDSISTETWTMVLTGGTTVSKKVLICND